MKKYPLCVSLSECKKFRYAWIYLALMMFLPFPIRTMWKSANRSWPTTSNMRTATASVGSGSAQFWIVWRSAWSPPRTNKASRTDWNTLRSWPQFAKTGIQKSKMSLGSPKKRCHKRRHLGNSKSDVIWMPWKMTGNASVETWRRPSRPWKRRRNPGKASILCMTNWANGYERWKWKSRTMDWSLHCRIRLTRCQSSRCVSDFTVRSAHCLYP